MFNQTKTIEQLTMEKLEEILELLEKGTPFVDDSMLKIDECSNYIKQMSPLYQSKVSLFWDNGVLGSMNALKQASSIPNMKATMAASLIPVIKAHVLNTLNILSAAYNEEATISNTGIYLSDASVDQKPNEECQENEASGPKSVDEILNDSSLSAKDKLVELSYFEPEFLGHNDYVDLFDDEIKGLNSILPFIPYESLKSCPNNVDADLLWELDSFLQTKIERLEAFCKVLDSISEDEFESNESDKKYLARCKIVAFIYRSNLFNSTYVFCRDINDYNNDVIEYVNDFRTCCFEIYKYAARMYTLMREYVDMLDFNASCMDICECFRIIDELRDQCPVEYYFKDSPTEWLFYVSQNSVSSYSNAVLDLELDYIQKSIDLMYKAYKKN